MAAALRRVVDRHPFYPKDEASHALLAYDLIFPELRQYRGGWFRASRFTEENADAWFASMDGDIQRVEGMINHLDVFQDYPGVDGEYNVADANALAEVIAFAWPLWAKQMYDIEIECRVYFIDGTDGEEPEADTVTFWTAK